MRRTRFLGPVMCAMVTSALVLLAQSDRKPGLYETTSKMTWEKSPFPPGMQMPGGANNPLSGAPQQTREVCVTQEMIDKGERYTAPTPQIGASCEMKDIQKSATGMTADYVCNGQLTGTGKLEAKWSAEQSHTKLHFTGNMQMGPQSAPVEWTVESTSVYKTADCGNVKPVAVK